MLSVELIIMKESEFLHALIYGFNISRIGHSVNVNSGLTQPAHPYRAVTIFQKRKFQVTAGSMGNRET
jgi:hypothetical protein